MLYLLSKLHLGLLDSSLQNFANRSSSSIISFTVMPMKKSWINNSSAWIEWSGIKSAIKPNSLPPREYNRIVFLFGRKILSAKLSPRAMSTMNCDSTWGEDMTAAADLAGNAMAFVTTKVEEPNDDSANDEMTSPKMGSEVIIGAAGRGIAMSTKAAVVWKQSTEVSRVAMADAFMVAIFGADSLDFWNCEIFPCSIQYVAGNTKFCAVTSWSSKCGDCDPKCFPDVPRLHTRVYYCIMLVLHVCMVVHLEMLRTKRERNDSMVAWSPTHDILFFPPKAVVVFWQNCMQSLVPVWFEEIAIQVIVYPCTSSWLQCSVC